MRRIVSLLVLTFALGLAACGGGDASSGTGSGSGSGASGVPWSSLNDQQKLVLSVAEPVWDSIPADRQQFFLAGADRWYQMQPAEQYSMINEVRDFAKLPHIGPDAGN